jgi:cyclase
VNEGRKTRVIPALLLQRGGLVKTRRFRAPAYVGDPINAVKIFNEKEVDEIALLDITATEEGREPDYRALEEIAGEAFMPLAYGGGVKTVEQAARIFRAGAEKVILNTAAFEEAGLVRRLADRFGSQSVLVSLDVGRDWLGRLRVFTRRGRGRTGLEPAEAARRMENEGAGELVVHSIEREGMGAGYDLPVIRAVADAVAVPVVALGGAGRVEDFGAAVREGHASAVMAGSLFVFHGPHRAVLIQFPEAAVLDRILAAREDNAVMSRGASHHAG